MRIAPTLPPTPDPGQKAQLRSTAVAFEAMMLKQILQSALPPPGGANADWHAMALDGLARDLAAQQPFGLARLLETLK